MIDTCSGWYPFLQPGFGANQGSKGRGKTGFAVFFCACSFWVGRCWEGASVRPKSKERRRGERFLRSCVDSWRLLLRWQHSSIVSCAVSTQCARYEYLSPHFVLSADALPPSCLRTRSHHPWVLQVWSARDSVTKTGCRPNSTNDGKLVFATCALSNFELFWDFAGLRRLSPSDLTGVRLVRHAEVYEWHQEYSVTSRADSVLGGLVMHKDYRYSKVWSEQFERSDSFAKPTTCALMQNAGAPCWNQDPSEQPWWRHGPDRLELGRLEMGRASHLRFGEYELPLELLNQVGEDARILRPKCDFPLSREDWHWKPGNAADRQGDARTEEGGADEGEWCDFLVEGQQSVRVQGHLIYYLNLKNRTVGLTEDFPGDVRVWYSLHTTESATILAEQLEHTSFGPWIVPLGTNASDGTMNIFAVRDGFVGADALIEDALGVNEYSKWFVRASTALVAFMAAALAAFSFLPASSPFVTPCLGEHAGGEGRAPSASLLGFMLSAGVLALWLLVEAVLWLAFRPSVGLPLLAIRCASPFAFVCCVSGWLPLPVGLIQLAGCEACSCQLLTCVSAQTVWPRVSLQLSSCARCVPRARGSRLGHGSGQALQARQPRHRAPSSAHYGLGGRDSILCKSRCWMRFLRGK